jgi:hypothetical protein
MSMADQGIKQGFATAKNDSCDDGRCGNRQSPQMASLATDQGQHDGHKDHCATHDHEYLAGSA